MRSLMSRARGINIRKGGHEVANTHARARARLHFVIATQSSYHRVLYLVFKKMCNVLSADSGDGREATRDSMVQLKAWYTWDGPIRRCTGDLSRRFGRRTVMSVIKTKERKHEREKDARRVSKIPQSPGDGDSRRVLEEIIIIDRLANN